LVAAVVAKGHEGVADVLAIGAGFEDGGAARGASVFLKAFRFERECEHTVLERFFGGAEFFGVAEDDGVLANGAFKALVGFFIFFKEPVFAGSSEESNDVDEDDKDCGKSHADEDVLIVSAGEVSVDGFEE
jgi:hypothetical protein